MTGTGYNVILLFFGQVDEAYCVTRNTNGEVCILGLFRVGLAVLELFNTEYIYVQVMCTAGKVSVHYVYKVCNAFFFVVTQSVGVDCLCVKMNGKP